MKNTVEKMNRKNAGFTLLELVVVVAVMGLISTMAMEVYTDHSNQKRFEATKERLAEIKFAIIGDPMMRVGSQAVLSGFFNDMGRLPRNLKELITPYSLGFCLHDTDYIVDTSATDAATCAALLVGSWTWTADDSANWNGPYLTSQSGGAVFTDAWGNKGGDNFGWKYNATTDVSGTNAGYFGYLSVQSLGLGSGSGDYEKDYPAVSATPIVGEFLIHKVDLDNIVAIKSMLTVTPAYCVNTVTSNINLAVVDSTACAALPATPKHIWVVFP